MQAYSNPKRASDPHALPDVEVWQASYRDCPECGQTIVADPSCHYAACHECNDLIVRMDEDAAKGFFWQSCFPGCLPDSDPIGPFDTQEEALADAQQGAEEEEL